MAKRGPKPYKPDWNQVDKMCAIRCTGEEIAGCMSIDYDTLAAACKRDHKMKFSEYIEQKGCMGKMSLRRAQYTNAVTNMIPSMQIWLGKNWLGQKDKEETETKQSDMSEVLSKLIDKLPS